MTYVDGFVIPVPREKLEAYKDLARRCNKTWREYGALDCVECLGDDVPYGELTSFRAACRPKRTKSSSSPGSFTKSRQSRDEVMKKVLGDDRPQEDDGKPAL